MKTIILGMLFALSCNYCFAQLKIENSTPKPEKKDVYDVSQDLYIRESHRGRFNDSLDYKSYYSDKGLHSVQEKRTGLFY